MAGPITIAPRRFAASGGRELAGAAVLLSALAVCALTSESRQWEPTTLVAALAMVMVLADVAVVWARKLRVWAGQMVQTTIMALLGPAPAVAIGVLSISSSTASSIEWGSPES